MLHAAPPVLPTQTVRLLDLATFASMAPASIDALPIASSARSTMLLAALLAPPTLTAPLLVHATCASMELASTDAWKTALATLPSD